MCVYLLLLLYFNGANASVEYVGDVWMLNVWRSVGYLIQFTLCVHGGYGYCGIRSLGCCLTLTVATAVGQRQCNKMMLFFGLASRALMLRVVMMVVATRRMM